MGDNTVNSSCRRENIVTASGVTTPLDRALKKAIGGEAVPEEQAGLFAQFGNGRLPELCAAAAQLRDHGKGKTVTFSPKVFIPLTMLCRDFCGYCTFRRDPSSGQKLYMSPDEVLKVALAGQRLGCTEALFTLGSGPNSVISRPRNGWSTGDTAQPWSIWRTCASWWPKRPTFYLMPTPGP